MVSILDPPDKSVCITDVLLECLTVPSYNVNHVGVLSISKQLDLEPENDISNSIFQFKNIFYRVLE